MPSTANCKRWRHDEQRSSVDEREPEDDLYHPLRFIGKRKLGRWLPSRRMWKLLQSNAKPSRSWIALYAPQKISRRHGREQNLFRSESKRVLHEIGFSRGTVRFFERALRRILFQQGRQWKGYSRSIRASLSEQDAAFAMEAA